MKKIFYLLIGVLLLPSMVKADLAAPAIITYEAIVNNPDGVDIYKYDNSTNSYVKTGEKAPYGTTYKVADDNYFCVDYTKCDLFIDAKELTPIEKNYKLDKSLLTDEIDAYVLKDIEIKKGPAITYESTNTIIKAGENIKIRGINLPGHKDSYFENPWYYVEYKGVKGYISILESSITYNLENKDVIFSCDVSITDPITKEELTKIKANTKVNMIVGETDPWTCEYYVEYEGYKGYTNCRTLFMKLDKEYKKQFEEDVKVYKTYDGHNFYDVITTIPKGISVDITYDSPKSHIEYFYEKDDVIGWILEYEDQKPDEENNIKPASKPRNDKLILYICIGISVFLSFTAIVLVIIINKKLREK